MRFSTKKNSNLKYVQICFNYAELLKIYKHNIHLRKFIEFCISNVMNNYIIYKINILIFCSFITIFIDSFLKIKYYIYFIKNAFMNYI